MNTLSRKLTLMSAISSIMVAGIGCQAEAETAEDVTEARQESQILTTYALSRHLDAHDIEVNVDDGVATLTGKVNEDINKELAQQIALGVTGITSVDNQVEIDADYVPSRTSEERSYLDVVEDASITASVKSKLLWSKYAEGLSANVETKSGVVTLDGTATSPEAKEIAGLLAKNTRNVRSVTNRLTVEDQLVDARIEAAKEQTEGLSQRISDTWITTKVKSTLMYSSNVNSSDISVSTKEGVVTLSGQLASGAEYKLAIELARNVKGVTRVDAQTLSHS